MLASQGVFQRRERERKERQENTQKGEQPPAAAVGKDEGGGKEEGEGTEPFPSVETPSMQLHHDAQPRLPRRVQQLKSGLPPVEENNSKEPDSPTSEITGIQFLPESEEVVPRMRPRIAESPEMAMQKKSHRRSRSLPDVSVVMFDRRGAMSGPSFDNLPANNVYDSSYQRSETVKVRYDLASTTNSVPAVHGRSISVGVSAAEAFRIRSTSMSSQLKEKKKKVQASMESLRPRVDSFAENQISYSRTDINGEGQINNYRFIRELGKGSYGTVKEAIHSEDGKKYAIKIISKQRLRKTRMRNININNGPRSRSPAFVKPRQAEDDLEEIKQEIAVLKKISRHPYFVRLVEFLSSDNDDYVYMVFDLCERGAIMKMQIGKEVSHFTEPIAHRYFRQLILAVEYLHSQKVIHRDIKPENILLNAHDEIQLADFGVAHIFDGHEDWLQNSQGTPSFSPPEVCSASMGKFHGKAVDIWALGVTLYCFIFGRCPFEANSIPALYKKILTEETKFPRQINPYLQLLITRMLEKDPLKRITIEEIRAHPWVTNGGVNPLPPKENNIELIEVTTEDVNSAVRKVKSITTRLKDVFNIASRRRTEGEKTLKRGERAISNSSLAKEKS